MFGWQPLQPEEPSFSDLGGWYDGYVEAALAHGAFDSADVFRPRDAITRREMAVMLVRALGFGPLAAQVQTASLPFTDVSADRGYITIAHDIGMSGPPFPRPKRFEKRAVRKDSPLRVGCYSLLSSSRSSAFSSSDISNSRSSPQAGHFISPLASTSSSTTISSPQVGQTS